MGLGLLFIEASRSYSDTPHSVGLFWVRDRTLAETSILTTQNTHKRQTDMLPEGFEHAVTESERSQTDALDRVFSSIVCIQYSSNENSDQVN